jgi:hypothetical protein
VATSAIQRVDTEKAEGSIVYVVSQGNGLKHPWDVLPACVCMTIINHSWYVCRASHLSTVRSVAVVRMRTLW